MDDSTLPLDMQNKSLDEDITMTQCESDTTALDNQDAVVNSSSPTLFLITIPGYSTVRVTQQVKSPIYMKLEIVVILVAEYKFVGSKIKYVLTFFRKCETQECSDSPISRN